MDRKSLAGSEGIVEGSEGRKSFLLHGLAELASSSVLCDIGIRNGQRRYRIHKVVLTAVSPKYAQLFLADRDDAVDPPPPLPVTSQKEEDIVVVGEVSKEVFEEVLTYMYSGCFVFSDENVDGALQAAASLDLVELSKRGAAYLANFNVHNVLRFLAIASRCQQQVDGGLLKRMHAFARHRLSTLSETPEFTSVSVDTLRGILESNPLENGPGALRAILAWIRTHKEERLQHAPTLLQSIHPAKLTPEDLDVCRKNDPEILDGPSGVDFLLKVYRSADWPTHMTVP